MIRSCWNLRGLIKDSLSRHNEPELEQLARRLLRVSPWAALGHVSGQDSHHIIRKSLLSRDRVGAASSRHVGTR